MDKVLDEINEQADQMSQIQDAMSQPMGGAAAIDDDDLMAELEVPIQGFCVMAAVLSTATSVDIAKQLLSSLPKRKMDDNLAWYHRGKKENV